MQSIVAKRDLFAGLVLILFGVGVSIAARQHPLGTLTNMQAGFFPLVLGILLAGLGALIAAGHFFNMGRASNTPHPDEEEYKTPSLRGCAAIIGSVIAFVALGRSFGMAPATFFSVLIAASGDKDSTLLGSIGLAIFLTVVAIGLFAEFLKIPLPVLQW